MGGRGGILVKCHDENFRELRHFKRPTSHTPTPPPQVSPPPSPNNYPNLVKLRSFSVEYQIFLHSSKSEIDYFCIVYNLFKTSYYPFNFIQKSFTESVLLLPWLKNWRIWVRLKAFRTEIFVRSQHFAPEWSVARRTYHICRNTESHNTYMGIIVRLRKS